MCLVVCLILEVVTGGKHENVCVSIIFLVGLVGLCWCRYVDWCWYRKLLIKIKDNFKNIQNLLTMLLLYTCLLVNREDESLQVHTQSLRWTSLNKYIITEENISLQHFCIYSSPQAPRGSPYPLYTLNQNIKYTDTSYKCQGYFKGSQTLQLCFPIYHLCTICI